MSTADTTPPARFGWIRPWCFLSGLALGTAALALLGWRVSRTDIHPGFVRFHSMMTPEQGYYPSVNEMSAIVRARCRPDQVLVIVGGNSILLGVWQRDVDIWTQRLQELLGDKYCVVNLAFRGAYSTDGGAVVAEALRKEFPRQILIANTGLLTGLESMGHGPYRYLFWQAYFGGKLLDYPEREARVREFRRENPEQANEFIETRISAWFDRLLRYQDLWNWVTLRHVGTVPSPIEPYFPRFLKPHGAYPDPEPDGTDPQFDDVHYPPATLDAELNIVTGPRLNYSRDAGGRWILAEVTRKDLLTRNNSAVPPELRARTLMLVSGSSPYYIRRLSDADKALVAQATKDSVSIDRQAGYSAIDYGSDFEPEDFGDRTHLTKLGGWKLAAVVAPQVREMSERLGYLK